MVNDRISLASGPSELKGLVYPVLEGRLVSVVIGIRQVDPVSGGMLILDILNCHWIYPLVNVYIAIEHDHRNSGKSPLKTVIFHSNVSLPKVIPFSKENAVQLFFPSFIRFGHSGDENWLIFPNLKIHCDWGIPTVFFSMFCQWPFQEPKMIGGTYHIFLAYFSGLCKWISPQNMAKHMVQ